MNQLTFPCDTLICMGFAFNTGESLHARCAYVLGRRRGGDENKDRVIKGGVLYDLIGYFSRH